MAPTVQVERPGWAPQADVLPETAFFYTSVITEKQFDGTVSPEKGIHSIIKFVELDQGIILVYHNLISEVPVTIQSP